LQKDNGKISHYARLSRSFRPKPTIEDAGVKLLARWHPHRRIESITYVLAGSVEHGDSVGKKGEMTAATRNG
jgi:redox-sensitive bicupin YhaK (pirin superfamily)